jgi:hypothetical protein
MVGWLIWSTLWTHNSCEVWTWFHSHPGWWGLSLPKSQLSPPTSQWRFSKLFSWFQACVIPSPLSLEMLSFSCASHAGYGSQESCFGSVGIPWYFTVDGRSFSWYSRLFWNTLVFLSHCYLQTSPSTGVPVQKRKGEDPHWPFYCNPLCFLPSLSGPERGGDPSFSLSQDGGSSTPCSLPSSDGIHSLGVFFFGTHLT